ncbi:MAG TPA: radical SAM family heme chaperone HemW [Gemmatimonadales bacterium]|nr:radical SAM family heme chaperone HemW [Gemmatimonadales bacterium]
MRHLYIHIPFCARRCSYCDFSIAVRKRIPAREFLACVERELGLLESAPQESLDSVYLGGGTPSLLPADATAGLLSAVMAAFPQTASDAIEITLEANPEDVTPDAARAWRRAGINRVSLGAQSFDDRVLRWMHRAHDATRIGVAMQTLRETGFDNVSLDLIFAVPADLGRDWSRDLDRALALRPEHLSLYGLTVEERTPLARWIARGATAAPDDERYAAEYLFAHERLREGGYRFYEVSNASLPERRSRHNSAYWADRPYLGLGPAAHSYDGSVRRWNLAAWQQYRQVVMTGRSPIASTELLTADQRELERVYLGLRTADGLALTASDRLRPPLTAWQAAGWVELRGDRLVCTPEGWLRLDALVRDLTRLGD